MKKLTYCIIDFFTFRQLKYLREFNKLDKLTIGELREFQLEKLNKNLGIRTWGEFYKLPITTKNDLPDEPMVDIPHHQHETSGSTGEPRIIWVPKETWHRKDAIFTRSWERMGRKFNERVFRLMAGEPKYAWYDSWRNVFPTNYRNITLDTVREFVKIQPKIIHGPGGAIRQLCELLIQCGQENSLEDVSIEWCSESPEGHEERLKPFVKAFHQQYGLAELPTVGSPDGEGNIRVVMEQGVIEILDDNGHYVEDGEEGFIVVTDFNNTLMPIIRYKCGDRGKMRKYTNKDGLTYYILYDIIGRSVDFYNGVEVKKPIGWSIVSPISHILGDVINMWRIEVHPKLGKAILYVRYNDGVTSLERLDEYSDWVYVNYGLKLLVEPLEEEKYDIYFKNKLVKVVV